MEQSSELKDIMLRLYAAVSQGDLAFTERLLPGQGEVLLIGTAPAEWVTDPAVIIQAFKAQAQAGIKIIPGDPQAYREGSVGWAADRTKYVLPDGKEVPMRVTAVFRQEGGEWKLVQAHNSIGIPDEVALSMDLQA